MLKKIKTCVGKNHLPKDKKSREVKRKMSSLTPPKENILHTKQGMQIKETR